MYKICRAKCTSCIEGEDEMNKPGVHYKHQCNYDERRRKAESRRRKVIQKLKCEYRINLDDLKPNIVDNLVSQVEAFGKQKRIREKSKAERRLFFVRKLVQEEKYKRRGTKTISAVVKRTKKVTPTNPPVIDKSPEEEEEEGEGENSEGGEFEPVNELEFKEDTPETHPEEKQKESEPDECGPESFSALLTTEIKSLQRPPVAKQSGAIKETQLECNPSSVIFENCEPNKTYKQTYKITNVGLDIIHCRYVGIETKDLDTDQAVPFRVELTDNALLRPGLSFASKVRLFSLAEIPEIHCYLLYESRRKKNPNEHGVFRVPVSHFPARSIVDVSPSVLRFPSVTWNIATGKERSKHLKKSIRIRNTGTKDCSCFIASTSQSEESIDETNIENSDDRSPDFEKIIGELIDNVFEVFRFSQRYFVPVPAMSVVKIDVDFIPEYRGYHHHVAFVRFEGSHNCVEEKIELVGDIKKIPLRIEPLTIDLRICIVNSGVYERTFRVYNDSNNAFPVRLKVPGSMKEHSLVFPSCPVIQPWSYQTCSVRLFPRLTLSKDAYRYYKEDTKVLEFPVFIQPMGSNSYNLEKLKLYVFAIITDYSLQIKPAEIDFGVVNTLETVRTEIELTNHSMTELEYGFLELPMGVRIEPNFGFGVILPKETIPLHLLYSPVLGPADEEGSYSFQIKVSSIAELGGFGERLPHAKTESIDHLTAPDEAIYNTEMSETPKESLSLDDSTVDEEDEDLSFIDPAEELKILEEKQNRIREYLRQEEIASPTAGSEESVSVETDIEVDGEWCEGDFFRKELNVISCRAVLVKPLCELSATVVQLPATPQSSFSVTRIFLNEHSHNGDICNCGFKGKIRNSNKRSFEARFEFFTSSELVSIVPRVGHISQGESIPIAIIFRPEFSDEELIYQSRILKAEFLHEEETKLKEVTPLPQKSKSLIKSTKPNKLSSRQKKIEIESQDVNLTALEITPYDLFAGQKALQQMIDPFCFTVQAICIVKTLPCNGMPEKTERHSLVLIAPVIKPRFIYLGKCQEIRFGKVTVGDRARKMLEIQNISLRRISPRVSALNPHGPFICTTGYKMDKVDPEHIWRHPITFAPTGERGKEEEFFEIHSGATTIRLTVNGEGIAPKYTFTPNFELCVLEIACDVVSEVEFSIENHGEADLNLKFVGELVKSSSTFKSNFISLGPNDSKKSDLGMRKTERRQSQTAKRKFIFTEKIPPDTANQLDDFEPVVNPPGNLFAIVGLDSNDEIVLEPTDKAFLKIRCSPGRDESVSNRKGSGSNIDAYAIEYKVMLAKTTLLKRFVIIGTMNSNK